MESISSYRIHILTQFNFSQGGSPVIFHYFSIFHHILLLYCIIANNESINYQFKKVIYLLRMSAEAKKKMSPETFRATCAQVPDVVAEVLAEISDAESSSNQEVALALHGPGHELVELNGIIFVPPHYLFLTHLNKKHRKLSIKPAALLRLAVEL